MSKNDITGDEIKTKTTSDAYRDNYDKIFRKKKGLTDEQVEQIAREFVDPLVELCKRNRKRRESKLSGNDGTASKTVGT